MVPQRSLLSVTLVLLLLLGENRAASARQVPDPGKAAVESDAPTRPAEVPIIQRPYRIRAFVSFDPSTRVDARGRDRLLDAWRGLARRMVGPAWEIQVAESEGPAAAFVLEEVRPAAVKPLGEGVDKVWLMHGRTVEGGLMLSGRELDVTTGWLGSVHTREVRFVTDMARDLFRLSEQIFAPLAEIGEARGDVVPLAVQGSALPKGQGADAIAAVGSIFRPIRVFFNQDGSVLDIQKVLFSYLRVEVRDGGKTESRLVRGVRDPLTKRIPRKNRLIALGIKPVALPTKLRFSKLPDRQPAAGYILTSRPITGGPAREVATTDREGRVSVPAGFADGLVILRLIAGKAEPMVELPVMPGETDEELNVPPFDPRPLTINLETQLDALRDAIVDLVAVRSRLELRMKSREKGDDWAGVEQALAEFRKLPPRDVFVKRLERLEQEAQAQEARVKSLVLTKTARAQLADTKSLIDRYLDDETYRAYEDAVLRSKNRDTRATVAKPKPPPARPSATASSLTPAQEVKAAPQPAAPQPARPAEAAPVPF